MSMGGSRREACHGGGGDPVPDGCPCAAVLRRCFAFEPADRPTAAQLQDELLKSRVRCSLSQPVGTPASCTGALPEKTAYQRETAMYEMLTTLCTITITINVVCKRQTFSIFTT